ncbi:MAG: hypothetical protein V3U02_02930, partial [Calditrichia bacterium]
MNDHNGYQDPGETPDLIFNVKNIGLAVSEVFSIEIDCNNPEITLINPIVIFPALGVQNIADNSNSPVSVQIGSNLLPGEKISLIYYVTVNGLPRVLGADSITFTIGTPDILFSDDGEQGGSNFQFTGQWALTTSSSHSPTHSFTDSPSGVYPNYYDASLTSQTIDLQNTSAADLTYWTKWDIESSWDFATVEISTDNGISWNYLRAPHMTAGSGSGTQPTGVFGYDGTQSDWVQEYIDISAYTENLVKIRFHMTSDSYIQRDGWYIDDINIYHYPPADTIAPQIIAVSLQTVPRPNLPEYQIMATVYDNRSVADAHLSYKINNQLSQTLMTAQNDSEFIGSIPGQPAGTLIEYFVEAFDGQGNSVIAPPGAPDSMYTFWVLAAGPQISISEDSLNFILPRGLAFSQDLVITNVGSEPLHVSLSEELPVKMNPKNDQYSAYAGNSPNSNKVVVISDSTGDTNDPTIDVVQIEVDRVGLFGIITTSFDITFAAPPESGTIGIISIDLDQEFGTGVFPAPFGFNLPVYDIGSEIEIIFDIGNNFIDTMGIGPIAVALSAVDSTFLGFAPIQIQGNTASADFIYIPLFGGVAFDESFNLAATFLSFDNLAYPDYAPDYGHGTFGTDIPISWLSALPQQFSLAPGDSLLMPVKFVSVNEAGNYAANLNFASNDTTTPLKSVELNFTILEMLQPDFFLPVTVINDTVDTIFDSTGTFIIENHGPGELIYFAA